jgi:hypothetical protein
LSLREGRHKGDEHRKKDALEGHGAVPRFR